MVVKRWEGRRMLGAAVNFAEILDVAVTDRRGLEGWVKVMTSFFGKMISRGRWLVGEQGWPDGVVALRCKSPPP